MKNTIKMSALTMALLASGIAHAGSIQGQGSLAATGGAQLGKISSINGAAEGSFAGSVDAGKSANAMAQAKAFFEGSAQGTADVSKEAVASLEGKTKATVSKSIEVSKEASGQIKAGVQKGVQTSANLVAGTSGFAQVAAKGLVEGAVGTTKNVVEMAKDKLSTQRELTADARLDVGAGASVGLIKPEIVRVESIANVAGSVRATLGGLLR